MSEDKRPLFLQTGGYRRQRLIDAMRLIPFLGLFVMMVPVILLSGGTPTPLSRWVIYFFGIWLVIIVLTAVLTRILVRREKNAAEMNAAADGTH